MLRIGCKVRYLDDECEDNKDRVFTVYGVRTEVVLCSDEYGDLEAPPEELVLA